MPDPDYFEMIFAALAADMNPAGDFPACRPLLAHYTSIVALQGIVSNEELWFSHPLAMNDHEEMSFGMNAGAEAFRTHVGLLDACGTRDRYEILQRSFVALMDDFWNKQAFDTYIFCAAEHDVADVSGRLSQWRGYGGNGSGIAIVFDTSKFGVLPDSPFQLGKVDYRSRPDRLAWINQRLDVLSQTLKDNLVPDDQLFLATSAFLERLKLASLFSKDIGFSEEKEWRVVYRPHRDSKGLVNDMKSYAIGPRGIEPRLKVRLLPTPGLFADDMSLENLIDRIILGPAQTSQLVMPTVQRMLSQSKAPLLSTRVWASRTPFKGS